LLVEYAGVRAIASGNGIPLRAIAIGTGNGILREYREIVNCQTRARNSRKQSASWGRCDGRFPNRFWQNRVSLFAHAR